MKKPHGMAKVAWEAYKVASDAAIIDIYSRADWRVVQALGDAVASAGYHLKDGMLDGEAYTAAADFSVKGLTNTQKATWLEELCRAGFAAFYRNWPGNLHIHANYCGVPQKNALDGQNEDFFRGRDGLVGHRRIDDEWWFPQRELRRIPEAMFRVSNGEKPRVLPSPMVAATATRPEQTKLSYALYLDTQKPALWMPVIDSVAMAPVRAYGTMLGFDVHYIKEKKQVEFDGKDVPIPLTIIAGVAHAPIRELARESGLKLSVDPRGHKVVLTR